MSFSQLLPHSHYAEIQDDLRTAMDREGIDLLVLDHFQDVAYATGFFFHPLERPIVVAIVKSDIFLLVPEVEREYTLSQQIATPLAVYFEFPGIESPFASLARTLPIAKGRAAWGPAMETRRTRELAAVLPGFSWGETDLVERQRMVKRPAELVLHREAARIADAMVAAGAERVRELLRSNASLPTEAELMGHVAAIGTGIVEREHVNIIPTRRMVGGTVYSGANSAFPHGSASSHRLSIGENFMITLGFCVGGRYAESERTFFIGEPDARQTDIYEAVFRAQKAGTDAMAPGRPASGANEIALGILRNAGYGDNIRHRLGHGIGMASHEGPWIETGETRTLVPGMVVSSEPALYVSGVGGFRISDTVLVGETAPERLTRHSRDLAQAILS